MLCYTSKYAFSITFQDARQYQIFNNQKAENAFLQNIKDGAFSGIADPVIQPAGAVAFPENRVGALRDMADLAEALHADPDGFAVVFVVRLLFQPDLHIRLHEFFPVIMICPGDRKIDFHSANLLRFRSE